MSASKEKDMLAMLRSSLSTLNSIEDIGTDTLSELASNRAKIEKIHEKVAHVNSDVDNARVIVRQMDKRNKYWFIPSWLLYR